MVFEAINSREKLLNNELGYIEGQDKYLGLGNFTKWKQSVVQELIKDQILLKLVYYNTPDALEKPDLTQEQINELITYNPTNNTQRIFQYRHISDLAIGKTSYISMDFAYFKPYEGFRLFSEKYILGLMYIYILSDKDIFETNYGIRQDLLLDRVYKILDGTRNIIGIGELKMETQLPLYADNNSFGGYSIGFKVSDLA